jgi:hypothetical protein
MALCFRILHRSDSESGDCDAAHIKTLERKKYIGKNIWRGRGWVVQWRVSCSALLLCRPFHLPFLPHSQHSQLYGFMMHTMSKGTCDNWEMEWSYSTGRCLTGRTRNKRAARPSRAKISTQHPLNHPKKSSSSPFSFSFLYVEML